MADTTDKTDTADTADTATKPRRNTGGRRAAAQSPATVPGLSNLKEVDHMTYPTTGGVHVRLEGVMSEAELTGLRKALTGAGAGE